jgi:hypothetical protein
LEKDNYFQQAGAPPHYHNNVRSFFNVHFLGTSIQRS